MDWINAIVQGILLGGLYALFAAGLSLIFGIMRLVNIAHGDLIIASAYLAYFVSKFFGIDPFLGLAVVVPGNLLQRLLLNRALGEELPPLLITFGLSVIVQNVLLLGFTPDSKRLQVGALEIASWEPVSGIYVGALPFLQLLTAIAIIGGLQFLFYKTAMGRAFRAVSDDPEVAQLMGLENKQLFAFAMGIALAVAAIAGTFIAIRTNFDSFTGPSLLVYGFEAIIIGGLGSLWGTLAGGVVLGVAQTLGGHINVAWPVLAGHLAFLLVLLVRKNGLFPSYVQ
jgi:branched-chain amino acid transport system permease protein